ncbi:MAG: VWA domain-containing protein [Verrucomicrobia bacterium]|nr:VWA domain-containing protein [Verrucomicrobiota bacterium]MCH8512642.1 VWA domain-containing protein [Kiritimatiellia bacterium]
MNKNALSLFENPAPRCPVALLLDTSSSMSGAPINALNEGILRFFQEIHTDEVARFSVETTIISFGDGGVRQALPFTATIDPVRAPRLRANGMTPMGGAIDLGLREIHERRKFYKRNGISAFKPWMVVMSDGGPNDNWTGPAEQARRLSDENALVFLGVGIGDGVDWDTFNEIMPVNRPPKALDGIKFKEFFEWLSDSLHQVSVSSPSQNVSLPPTNGWEAI